MSTFDEFVNGAKKCLDVAAEKTHEVIEASVSQIERSQLNCKLKEEYARLGKTYFTMVNTGIDQTVRINNSIGKIKDIQSEIETINENKDSKPINKCIVCGNINPQKAEYCNRCGEPLVL